MKFKTANLISFLLVLAAFAIAVWFYPQLPDPVPTHWNSAGQIDGYLPKPWGVFMLPLTMAGIWIVLAVLPRISPKGYRLDIFQSVYGLIQLVLMAALLVTSIVALLAATNRHMAINTVTPIVLGLLFIILGNYMGKLRKNFFIGIRTPWTLASDEVWARTHRLGGWLFVAGGLAIVITGVLAPSTYMPIIMIVIIAVAALVPAAASYVIYRRVEGFGSKDDTD
ncbi:MAG: SdpI family protein [Gammaproteobacteria bacterium]